MTGKCKAHPATKVIKRPYATAESLTARYVVLYIDRDGAERVAVGVPHSISNGICHLSTRQGEVPISFGSIKEWLPVIKKPIEAFPNGWWKQTSCQGGWSAIS